MAGRWSDCVGRCQMRAETRRPRRSEYSTYRNISSARVTINMRPAMGYVHRKTRCKDVLGDQSSSMWSLYWGTKIVHCCCSPELSVFRTFHICNLHSSYTCSIFRWTRWYCCWHLVWWMHLIRHPAVWHLELTQNRGASSIIKMLYIAASPLVACVGTGRH